MSKTTVNQVIQRAISDAAFRRQLQRDPANALAGFDLSKDERAAITSGDPSRLTGLGVDQRMSKAFVIGGMGEASKVLVSDAGTSGNAVLVDESGATGQGALIDDGGSSDAVLVSDAGASGSGVIVGDPTAPDAEGFLPTINVGDTTSAATVEASDSYYPEMTLPARSAGDTTSAAEATVGDAYPEMTLPARGAGDTSSAASAIDTLDTSGDANVIDSGLAGGTETAFEPTSASGDLNVLDAGIPGGSSTGALDADDLGSTTSGAPESAHDMGGDVHPTEY